MLYCHEHQSDCAKNILTNCKNIFEKLAWKAYLKNFVLFDKQILCNFSLSWTNYLLKLGLRLDVFGAD